MKKIIVFDMGNVLADHRWRRLAEDLGYPEELILQMRDGMFCHPLWVEFDRGVMADEEIIEAMKEQNPHLSSYIDEVYELQNFGNVVRAYQYSEELVRTLKEMGYPVYILSNFGLRLLDCVRGEFTFLDYVDGEIISAAVKAVKPDRDIFDALFKKYDINPEDAIFFDDSAANVEASKRYGMEAVLVGERPFVSIAEGLKKYCGIELKEMYHKYRDIPRHDVWVSSEL